MTKKIQQLEDLQPDRRNANRGTPRGRGVVEGSLRKYGAGRSILVDRDGEVIAGNKTLDAAAEIGLPVRVVQTDGRELVVVQRTDLDLDQDTAARELAIADNRASELGLEWDEGVLAELAQEVDLSQLFTDDELDALLVQTQPEPATHSIKGHSDGYDFRETHAGKLAYRVEAAWRAAGDLGIDLYSGQGQLAYWYQRRFTRLIRIDRERNDGLDAVSDAEAWLCSDDFAAVAQDFDFIDFDDEGSPLRAVAAMFAALPPRDRGFVLCVTDGSGLNLKLHGRLDPSLYGLPGPQRRATTEDYARLEDLVSGAVVRFADSAGYAAHLWSSVRGSENNMAYQTFLIQPRAR